MYAKKEGRIKVARLLGMHAHAYPNELRICFDLKHKYRSVELLDAMSYNINSKIFKSSIWPEINFIRSKSNLFITTIRFVMSVILLLVDFKHAPLHRNIACCHANDTESDSQLECNRRPRYNAQQMRQCIPQSLGVIVRIRILTHTIIGLNVPYSHIYIS